MINSISFSLGALVCFFFICCKYMINFMKFMMENILKGLGFSLGVFLGFFFLCCLIHLVVPDEYVHKALCEHEKFKQPNKVLDVCQS